MLRLFSALVVLLLLVFLSGCGGGSPKSVFDDQSCVCSPNGIVPDGAKAYSPDGKYFAREISPTGYGKIGIYLQKTGVLDHEILVETGNPNLLKAMAWSRDSKYLAVMYHGSYPPYMSYYGINLYEVATGSHERQITSDQYHYMVFSGDNTKILASDYPLSGIVEYQTGLPPIAD